MVAGSHVQAQNQNYLALHQHDTLCHNILSQIIIQCTKFPLSACNNFTSLCWHSSEYWLKMIPLPASGGDETPCTAPPAECYGGECLCTDAPGHKSGPELCLLLSCTLLPPAASTRGLGIKLREGRRIKLELNTIRERENCDNFKFVYFPGKNI